MTSPAEAPGTHTEPPRAEPQWLRMAAGGSLAVMAAALLALAVLEAVRGIFTRLVADDLCLAVQFNELGYVNSQIFEYRSWSGHFVSMALIGLTSPGGLPVAQALPSIYLAVWTAVLTLAMRSVTRPNSLAPAIMFALAVVTLTIAINPNSFGSFYWENGGLTYGFPLILQTAWLGVCLAAHPGKRWAQVSSLVLSFAASGFSETNSAIQILITFLASATALMWASQRRLLAGLGFVGSLVGTAILAAAPGTSHHAASYPTRPSLVWAFTHAITDGATYEIGFLWNAHRPLLAVLALGFFAGLHTTFPARLRIHLALTIVTATAVAIGTFAPSYYATSAPPVGRVLIISSYALVLGTAIIGLLIGNRLRGTLRHPATQLAIAAAVLYGTLGISTYLLTSLPVYAAWAHEVDSNIASMRKTGVVQPHHAPVPTVDDEMWYEPSHNPDYWINRGMARYYGVPAVVVSGSRPDPKIRNQVQQPCG